MNNLRDDFPLLKSYPFPQLIYFDNAATTQKPQQVLNRMMTFYCKENANVHRSVHTLGEIATNEYENARKTVAQFIHAPSEKNIIFTKGTTESINLVAYSWGRQFLKKQNILTTELEHHANLIPWQILTQEFNTQLQFIPCNNDGTLNLEHLDTILQKNIGLVAITHASNSLGTILPIEQIIQQAHQYNIPVLIDAAQTIPHLAIDVQKLDCDFLAFSGHKMCGPTGIGILYAKEHFLESMQPYQTGGEMIRAVWNDHATYNEIPYKFEAGTPPICEAIGLMEAIHYLQQVGMQHIHEQDQILKNYALSLLKDIPNIQILGQQENNVGIISFIIPKIHPHDLATFLNEYNIAVRAGHHCAQPLLRKLNLKATTRLSFYFYNTKQEIDYFSDKLKNAIKFFCH